MSKRIIHVALDRLQVERLLDVLKEDSHTAEEAKHYYDCCLCRLARNLREKADEEQALFAASSANKARKVTNGRPK